MRVVVASGKGGTGKTTLATSLALALAGGPVLFLSCPTLGVSWHGGWGLRDEPAGVDIRGRFIIDPDFVIRAMEVLTPEVGRNPDELIRQIRAFQHVRASGEVTPSGWQPGQITLKPGPALVGRVWEVWKP